MDKCPECCGTGGGVSSSDGEWSDCPCCSGAGTCSAGHYHAYLAELADLDARIDAEMNGICSKCGATHGEHVNRDDEPCMTAKQYNRLHGHV